MACGVTCARVFDKLGVGQPARVGLIRQLAERGELNPLELGLGDDLAVHLHEHLLEDLGRKRGAEPSKQRRQERFCISNP